MKRKTLLSVLLCFAMLLSMLSMTVSAKSITIFYESPRTQDVQPRAAASSAPALSAGNHVSFLDRVTGAPSYVLDFYNWMEDNANLNGALADPTLGSSYEGDYGIEYYHKITTITGSVSYPFTNQAEAVETGSALAKEALNAEFEIFNQWAGVAWDAFDREHPEVFWLSGQTSYSYLAGISFSLKSGVCTVHYEADLVIWLQYSGYDIRDYHYRTQEELAAGIQLRDVAVQEILANCPSNNVYNQILYLNDALTARNAYNSAVATGNLDYASTLSWKSISALEGNVGAYGPVCEGYARAFQLLCNKLEIPCVLVDGPAIDNLNDSPENHMWNYVQIDGGWYAVDVTWNDPYVAYAPTQKVSGSECRRWMLLGSDSQVALGLTFLNSHAVVNKVRNAGMSFTNGPVLEQNTYDPNAKAGFSVSGKVNSSGTGDVTVQLWQGSTLVGTVATSNGTYSFENVVPGSYQVTFLKDGSATFTQDLVVADQMVVEDVKLLLKGDVSGDGRLNVGDVARLYGHIKKTAVITNAYTLLAMDMTGDGRINVGDTARLYAQIRAK